WGHEHDMCVFAPYTMGPGQPLPAGRCLGASAVPLFPPEATAPTNLVIPVSETAPPQIIAGTALGNNGNVFNHAYAMIDLADAGLTITYYQLDSTDATPGKPPALTPLAYRDTIAS